MKLGARILKTGITLILAIYISELLNLEPVIYAAIAATLAIQPSLYRSLQYGLEQIQSNIVGATIAIIFSLYFGTNTFIIAIAVMLVIGINIKFHFERSIPLSIVTVLTIMEAGSKGSDFLLYALDRFLLILIGLLSAMIVNAVIYRPNYDKQLSDKLKTMEEKMSSLLRILLDTDKNERYIKKTIKSLEEELNELEQLFKFEEEAKSYLKKKLPFSASRKLVIYKNMLITAKLEIELFKKVDKYQNIIINLPDLKLIQKQLINLANYQDRIYSKFERKILPTNDFNYNNSLSIHIKIYEQIKNSNYGTDDTFAILNVLSIIREYNKQLDYLDKLINIYHTRHLS